MPWSVDYPNALHAIAGFRYDVRRERIPQLEAQCAAAMRMGRRDSERAALNNLALAYVDLGNTRKAIDLYQRCRVIACELGDRLGEGYILGNLGLCYRTENMSYSGNACIGR